MMLAVGSLLICTVGGAVAIAPSRVTPFSTSPLGAQVPDGWRVAKLPKVPRATRYEIVDDDGVHVLQATADRSMSGLSESVTVDPSRTPWLGWRWKVDRTVPGGGVGARDTDDYSARLYVLFDYDLSRLPFFTRMKVKMARALYGDAVPAAGLCYVWDHGTPVGTIVPSAFTDRLRMIVVASGDARAGQWVRFRRDVAADFEAAFGEPAPHVKGVAVATDTDNTGTRVRAWYGDIRFAATPSD
ncbi:MAG: DUF3047 domain-containing protein [Betaproteobacteria bacterium]|nr:DUF3047 domain-containing protein [Betaproteobacteria bacterium]